MLQTENKSKVVQQIHNKSATNPQQVVQQIEAMEFEPRQIHSKSTTNPQLIEVMEFGLNRKYRYGGLETKIFDL